MQRQAPLKRSSKLRASNRRRRKASHARNFGDEAEAVRRMPCLACGAMAEACHVTARGMGAVKGGRFDLVPLCRTHHQEAGEAGTSQRATFEREHDIDLRREADRIAVRHVEPAGLRPALDRWRVPGYEREALLAWARRRATSCGEVSRRLAVGAVAAHLWITREEAAELCEAAGVEFGGQTDGE